MEMTKIADHEISSLATIFPPLERPAFERLKRNIEEYGQLEPISRHDGLIIDGVHRLIACHELGMTPTIADLEDDLDPVEFVVSKNLMRRDLTKNQRARVAYFLSEDSQPGRPALAENQTKLSTFSQAKAAAVAGVSVTMIKNAKRVLSSDSRAIPEIRQACVADRVNINDALKVINLPHDRQLEALNAVLNGHARNLSAAADQITDREALLADADAAASFLTRDIAETTTVWPSKVSELHQHIKPESVQVIVTFPPTEERFIPHFEDLGAFAAHALAPDGVMAVIVKAEYLPQIISRLNQPDLDFLTEFDYRHPKRTGRLGHPHQSRVKRQPILIYGKKETRIRAGDDFVEESPWDVYQSLNASQLLGVGLLRLVSRLARPGDIVCDPVTCGRIGVAVGAWHANCTFVGAVEHEKMLGPFWARLEKAVGDESV